MKFKLEESYPRVWTKFNGESPKPRSHKPTTLEGYVEMRYWKKPLAPQYVGRTPRAHEIQSPLLDALRQQPRTMRELVRELRKTPTSVSAGIKALREKGYIIECRALTYYLIN